MPAETATLPDESKLTAKQRLIMNYFRFHLKQHGYPPSLRQIQEEIGARSVSVAQYHVSCLVAAGYLKRDARVARGLSIEAPGGAA